MKREGSDPLNPLIRIRDFVKRYVEGLDDLIQILLVALVSEGHVFIEGPVGSGKTLTARLIASSIGGVFKRVQMTPDLLPSDILGGYYYNISKGEWVFREGAVFANILFIDELSRAPPKTQSALLEVMQEGRVSIEGRSFEVPKPFLVIATRISASDMYGEGVYRLTHTLLDRFAYSYNVSYIDPVSEIRVLEKIDAIDDVIKASKIDPVASIDEIIELQRRVREIYVDDKIRRYVVDIITFIRGSEDVLIPPSPRASVWMLKGARALALLEDLDYVSPDHVKKIAPHVLRHRIVLRGEDRVDSIDRFIENVLSRVEVPK